MLAEGPLVGAGDECADELCVSGEPSEVEQRRGGLKMFFRKRGDVPGAQHLVAHGEPGVP